jgi:hypothetical protein
MVRPSSFLLPTAYRIENTTPSSRRDGRCVTARILTVSGHRILIPNNSLLREYTLTSIAMYVL